MKPATPPLPKTVIPRLEVAGFPHVIASARWGEPHLVDGGSHYWAFELDDGTLVGLEVLPEFAMLVVHSNSTDATKLRVAFELAAFKVSEFNYDAK